MSNRFYVNGVQIFGNNEMFPKTEAELEKQGAEWTDDGTFGEIEINDPEGLMNAVTEDIAEFLKDIEMNKEDFKTGEVTHKEFEELTDFDFISSFNNKSLMYCLYTEDGKTRKNAWAYFGYYIDEKRIFTPYNLYQAIRDDVEHGSEGLVLKSGHTITASMY